MDECRRFNDQDVWPAVEDGAKDFFGWAAEQNFCWCQLIHVVGGRGFLGPHHDVVVFVWPKRFEHLSE
jgi:hypothetical protein